MKLSLKMREKGSLDHLGLVCTVVRENLWRSGFHTRARTQPSQGLLQDDFTLSSFSTSALKNSSMREMETDG